MSRQTHTHLMHRGLVPSEQLGQGAGDDRDAPWSLPFAPGIVIELTNVSGQTLIPGNVVVYPADSADNAFTITSTPKLSTKGVGVLVGTHPIYNGSNARVLTAGFVNGSNYALNGSNFNVNGSNLTRGHFVYTGASKSALGQATLEAGAFGQVIKGGVNGTVYLWGSTEPASSGGTPAADPGDIATPATATAEDAALKVNTLMANMRTAGTLA